MNNPEAILFVNETIRPLCERTRALNIEINAMRTAWFGGIDTLFAAAGEAVEDGRDAQGISRLTCGDVTNAVAQMLKTATGEAQAWDVGIIQKPCVRTLP